MKSRLPWYSWLLPFYGELVYLRQRSLMQERRIEDLERMNRDLRKSLKSWQYNALHATEIPEGTIHENVS